MRTLSHEELIKQAPSIFAEKAHEKLSSKYAVIPTIDCVIGLEKAGFYPVKVQETKCRDENNRAYAKHLIRFRHQRIEEVGDNIPEILLINSHDGTSSYQLRAGIYRCVCSNGLIIGNDLFHRRVRHQGNVIEKVVESAGEIIDIMPHAIKVAGEWKKIVLNKDQKNVFAESAKMLKWDGATPFSNEKLLQPRRNQDISSDLWTTFNVLQENLIRGGVRYYDAEQRRRGSTRPVKSVNETTRLNTALWNLTEKMAELAHAA